MNRLSKNELVGLLEDSVLLFVAIELISLASGALLGDVRGTACDKIVFIYSLRGLQ